MSYEIVRQAIVDRASLTATYDDYVRRFSPHIIGKNGTGVPVVIAFQYSGGKPGGLLVSGEWCRFLLSRLHYVRRNSDRWLEGPVDARSTVGLIQIDTVA